MDSYRIIWSDDLLIGDEKVDSQHKYLIELIANIPESTSRRDDALLSEALQYAAKHFSDEEAYMARIKYPDFNAHRKKHKKLRRVLLAYKKAYDNGEKDLYSLKQFMLRWVRDHIMDVDKKIGEYARSMSKS